MKQIRQFRFFDNSNPLNYPKGLSKNNLVSGKIFHNYSPITQLGIQALPGTIFYLNDDNSRSNPIIIGYTGLYELNLEGIAEINTLSFDEKSLQRISSVNGACLIIDIVYEESE